MCSYETLYELSYNEERKADRLPRRIKACCKTCYSQEK